MDNAIEPVVGQWYRHRRPDKSGIFQVVGLDADDSTVEVQYFDGDIEELSDEDWHSQRLENCAAPEDSTGPYDEISDDDLGYSDTEPARGELTEPLARDPAGLVGTDEDEPGEEADD